MTDRISVPASPDGGRDRVATGGETLDERIRGRARRQPRQPSARPRRDGALPVRQPGGVLAIGDMHASMGDGEICFTGVEISGQVTIRVSLLKGKQGVAGDRARRPLGRPRDGRPASWRPSIARPRKVHAPRRPVGLHDGGGVHLPFRRVRREHLPGLPAQPFFDDRAGLDPGARRHAASIPLTDAAYNPDVAMRTMNPVHDAISCAGRGHARRSSARSGRRCSCTTSRRGRAASPSSSTRAPASARGRSPSGCAWLEAEGIRRAAQLSRVAATRRVRADGRRAMAAAADHRARCAASDTSGSAATSHAAARWPARSARTAQSRTQLDASRPPQRPCPGRTPTRAQRVVVLPAGEQVRRRQARARSASRRRCRHGSNAAHAGSTPARRIASSAASTITRVPPRAPCRMFRYGSSTTSSTVTRARGSRPTTCSPRARARSSLVLRELRVVVVAGDEPAGPRAPPSSPSGQLGVDEALAVLRRLRREGAPAAARRSTIRRRA